MAVITRWSYKRGGRKAGFQTVLNTRNDHDSARVGAVFYVIALSCNWNASLLI